MASNKNYQQNPTRPSTQCPPSNLAKILTKYHPENEHDSMENHQIFNRKYESSFKSLSFLCHDTSIWGSFSRSIDPGFPNFLPYIRSMAPSNCSLASWRGFTTWLFSATAYSEARSGPIPNFSWSHRWCRKKNTSFRVIVKNPCEERVWKVDGRRVMMLRDCVRLFWTSFAL